MDINISRLPARSALTTNVSRVVLPTKGSPRCFGAGRNKRRREVERLSQWRERGIRWPVLSHQVHSLQRKHACGPRSSNGARGLPARAAVQDWNAQHPLQRATVPCICQTGYETRRVSLPPTESSSSTAHWGAPNSFGHRPCGSGLCYDQTVTTGRGLGGCVDPLATRKSSPPPPET